MIIAKTETSLAKGIKSAKLNEIVIYNEGNTIYEVRKVRKNKLTPEQKEAI